MENTSVPCYDFETGQIRVLNDGICVFMYHNSWIAGSVLMIMAVLFGIFAKSNFSEMTGVGILTVLGGVQYYNMDLIFIERAKLDGSFYFFAICWTFALVIFACIFVRKMDRPIERKVFIQQYRRYHLLSVVREMIDRTIDDQFIDILMITERVFSDVAVVSWKNENLRNWVESTNIPNTTPKIRGWSVLGEWLADHTGQILTAELYDELNDVMHTPKEKKLS